MPLQYTGCGVYEIIDPRTSTIVYVGKAFNCRKRSQEHLRRCEKGTHENPRLLALYRYLARVGITLEFQLWKECTKESVAIDEQCRIADHKLNGLDLFNVAKGGEGGAGPRSEATRKKISMALKGIKKPPRTAEHRAALAANRRGVKYTDEQRTERSLTMRERASRGNAHYLSKLTSSDVSKIKRMLIDGVPQSALARQFGVSRSSILQIKLGRSWTHVATEEVVV